MRAVLLALVVIPLHWISLQTYCAAQEDKAAKAILQDDPFEDVNVRVRGAQAVQGMAIPAMRLNPAMPMRPATGLPFDLSNLVLAKIDRDEKGDQLVALMDQTRVEKKNVTVTVMQPEVRKRTVKVLDAEGKTTEVEQEYNVMVPVTQDVERNVVVPAGKKPTLFPMDRVRIYRLDGTKVEAAESRKLLSKMSPIFLLRGFNGDIKPVEGVYLQALNPDCLIVVAEVLPQ